MQALTVLRAKLDEYESLDLNTLDNEEITKKLFAIRDNLGHIFQAYHGLQLAIVSETPISGNQRQVGIHCYWQEIVLLGVYDKPNKYGNKANGKNVNKVIQEALDTFEAYRIISKIGNLFLSLFDL